MPRDHNLSAAERFIKRQEEELYAIPGVSSEFHPPQSINYVFQLTPKHVNESAAREKWISQIIELNQADTELLATCIKLLKDQGDADGTVYVYRWAECLKNQTNLHAGKWLARVAKRLEELDADGRPFSEIIYDTDPMVIQRFLDIPVELLDVLRFNIYVPEALVPQAVQSLVSFLTLHDMIGNLEKLEVAKSLHGAQENGPAFPRLILYVDRRTSISHTALKQFSENLRNYLRQLDCEYGVRQELAFHWETNCTATQGFLLYKRYLDLLGQTDQIYDKDTHHGLVKGSVPYDVLTAHRNGAPPIRSQS